MSPEFTIHWKPEDDQDFDISNIDLEKIDYNLLKSEDEIILVKILDKFSDVIKRAAEEYEPSILTRYLIDVSSQFSRFYNNNQVIVDKKKIKKEFVLWMKKNT